MITSKKLTTLLTCGEDERFSIVDKMSKKDAKDLLKYLITFLHHSPVADDIIRIPDEADEHRQALSHAYARIKGTLNLDK